MPSSTEDLAAQVMAFVAHGESRGNYGAQNKNTDHQGLSFGLLQWSQKGGGLGKLLSKMNAADPKAFAAVFGADAGLLLKTTASSDEATRMSLPLWQEPWTSRFTAAGQVRAFQKVQLDLGSSGASWTAATTIANLFDVWTERALALFFDRANHHGGYGANKVANELYNDLLERDAPLSYPELLAAYAQRCAAGYRRSSPPEETVTKTGKIWKKVGNEWHLFAGKADLYAIIVRRTKEILESPALSDQDLAHLA
jgi:hypothetical protein